MKHIVLILLSLLASHATLAREVTGQESAEVLRAVKAALAKRDLPCRYWSPNNGGRIDNIPASQALWFQAKDKMVIDETAEPIITITQDKRYSRKVTTILLDAEGTKVLGLRQAHYYKYVARENRGTISSPEWVQLTKLALEKETRCGSEIRY